MGSCDLNAGIHFLLWASMDYTSDILYIGDLRYYFLVFKFKIMKQHYFRFFPLVLLFLALLSVFSCQNNQAEGHQTGQTGAQNNQVAIPSFEKLDGLPFSGMNKKMIGQSGEGDCENTVYRFTKDNWAVLLDSLSCGEYYRQRTFYQMTEAGDITMVHLQYLEPSVDPDSGTLFYNLDEKIMDFSGAEPIMRSRVDQLPRAASQAQGGFDLFSRSEARMIQTKGAVEELDLAYWQKRISSLQ